MTSSSAATQGSALGSSAWSPKNSTAGDKFACGATSLLALKKAPFNTGPDAVLVAYYASAELGCFLELGWPLPANVVDLFAEHRVATNGQKLPCGNDLLGALAIRGLAHVDAGDKNAMRQLIIGQLRWSETERRAILDYCASDVAGLARASICHGVDH